jgi:ankyrin repeat protein
MLHGFDINRTDRKNGLTAVMKAIQFGNVDCLEMFLNYGIDPKQKYRGKKKEWKGYTIFHFAIISDNKAILPILLKNLRLLKGTKTYLNRKNEAGQSPLELANILRDTFSVKFLLQYEA